MKKLICLSFMVLIFGCSSYLHPDSKHNNIIKEYNTYFTNDSLKISMVFPADIIFNSDSIKERLLKLEVKKFREHIKFKNYSILTFGFTRIPPYYSFVLAKGPRTRTNGNESDNLTSKVIESNALIKTSIGSQEELVFIAKAEKSPNNMLTDLKNSLESVTYGEQYSPVLPKSPTTIIMESLNKKTPESYLEAATSLEAKKENYTSKNDMFHYQQMFLTSAAMINGFHDFDSVEYEYERKRKVDIEKLFNDSIQIYTDAKVSEAIKLIADTSRVVMFNELHWDTRHRRQIIELLPLFKKSGYTHFGLEAFFHLGYNSGKGYPTDTSGFYIKEPSFAQMIREAYNLGFNVFGYEAEPEEDREKGQARNIYQRTLKNDPDAKVLIYAGVGHIHEMQDTDRKMMAAEFLNLSGINPTTIDQMYLGMSMKDSKYDKILVSRNEYKKMIPVKIETDFYLGTKKPTNASWQLGHLKSMEIDTSDIKLYPNDIYYSQLYYFDEFQMESYSAIPLYNHMGVHSNYMLKPGKYRWLVTNTFGDPIADKVITVMIE